MPPPADDVVDCCGLRDLDHSQTLPLLEWRYQTLFSGSSSRPIGEILQIKRINGWMSKFTGSLSSCVAVVGRGLLLPPAEMVRGEARAAPVFASKPAFAGISLPVMAWLWHNSGLLRCVGATATDVGPMKIDLHSHTFYSDGVLSPEELVQRAVEKKVRVLAITDHDTTDGLARAQAHIAAADLPLQLIPGVEISTSWYEFEIHLVGLQVNPADQLLQQRLQSQQQRRLERATEMARRLTKFQVPDCLPAVLELANGAALTRTHFARHLVNIGKAS